MIEVLVVGANELEIEFVPTSGLNVHEQVTGASMLFLPSDTKYGCTHVHWTLAVLRLVATA
jgi:hypothetical protein